MKKIILLPVYILLVPLILSCYIFEAFLEFSKDVDNKFDEIKNKRKPKKKPRTFWMLMYLNQETNTYEKVYVYGNEDTAFKAWDMADNKGELIEVKEVLKNDS